MSEPLELGDQVIIRSSRHPDVVIGTVGIVDVLHQGGYGVRIYGNWLVAGSDQGETKRSIQVVWYPGNELELTR